MRGVFREGGKAHFRRDRHLLRGRIIIGRIVKEMGTPDLSSEQTEAGT